MDILEFRVEVVDTVENWFSIDKLFNEFVLFIESKAIFFGGGGGPNYLQGSVYYINNQININSFIDAFILFFKKYNGIRVIYMGINIDFINSVNIDYYKSKYDDHNINFYYWDIED